MAESNKSNFGSAVIPLFAKGFIAIASWIPLGLNQALGRFIGRLLWWFPNSNKQVTLQNISITFPDLSITEQRALAKQSLLQLGMMVLELGPAWRWSKEKLSPLIKEIEGKEFLEEAVAQNKGIMFLSPHIGAWEVLAIYLSMHYPSTFLYRPPNMSAIEPLMVKSRGRLGAALAPTDVRGVRTLIQALKQNQITLVLPDQDAGEKGGIHAPFFGFPARTMTLASKLIQKTDCVPLFVGLERLGNAKGYKLHIMSGSDDLASKDDVVATQALNKGVEEMVKQIPEQYLWSYKRFRKPPEGYKNPYR